MIGTPATLTAPAVATPTTIRYVARMGNSAGQEGFRTVVAVTVLPSALSRGR